MAGETPPTALLEVPPPESVTVTEKESPSETLPWVEADAEKEMSPTVAAAAESVSAAEKEMPIAIPQQAPSISATEKEPSFAAAAEAEAESERDPQLEAIVTQVEAIELEKPKPGESKKVPQTLISFKEESNKISDLSDFERESLYEFKRQVREALNNNDFTFSPPNEKLAASDSTTSSEEVSIWGIPLLKDERSDLILLKFLRARDFKVKDSFVMLKDTLQWRKAFGADALVDEELGDDLEKVVFMHGHDREGHPVCYNVYGEFQNKELYMKTFSNVEKITKFLRWRIQFLERSIRKLDFMPGGISTVLQITDLKNSPGPAKRELQMALKRASPLVQDNYPEFVSKQVFINVPWWYMAFYRMISPFFTQRTKSKFVFAGPSRTAETLFKYIPPEQVPIHYGGLSVDFCDCNPEFSIDDPAAEIVVKPATKQTVEILVHEKCIIVWELRVVGWEVRYSAEYVANAEGAYTVIIDKPRKMTPTDEPVVSRSFKITELGKLLINIDNPTSKKKHLLYRFKVKPVV